MTTVQTQLVPGTDLSACGPTGFKTERNQRATRCGMCGTLIYVDEETFSFTMEAIKAGLDDPYLCDVCKKEYDELVYEG